MVWNGFDCPTCVFPVSKVDQILDVKQSRDKFFSKADEYYYKLCQSLFPLGYSVSYLFSLDDPAVWQNAPTCLQLVGHTLEEEAVIGMTEIVDAALKEYKLSKARL